MRDENQERKPWFGSTDRSFVLNTIIVWRDFRFLEIFFIPFLVFLNPGAFQSHEAFPWQMLTRVADHLHKGFSGVVLRSVSGYNQTWRE